MKKAIITGITGQDGACSSNFFKLKYDQFFLKKYINLVFDFIKKNLLTTKK